MNEALIHKIVALFHGGASMRRIAQSLGVSRRTVQRVLGRSSRPAVRFDRAMQPGRKPTRQPARRLRATITDLLARYPDITARRIHEELRRLGYTGGYTSSPAGARAASRPGRPPRAAVRDRAGGAGADGLLHLRPRFHDEGRRRVYAFSYVLGYSRRQYLHFVEARTSPRPSASTSAPSSTWAGSRRPAFMTT